jgi:hypothetical protein
MPLLTYSFNTRLSYQSETPRVKTRGFCLNNSLYVALTCHAREGGHPDSNIDETLWIPTSAGMTKDAIHPRFKKRAILVYLRKRCPLNYIQSFASFGFCEIRFLRLPDFHLVSKVTFHSLYGNLLSVKDARSQSGFCFCLTKNLEEMINTAGAA